MNNCIFKETKHAEKMELPQETTQRMELSASQRRTLKEIMSLYSDSDSEV